MAQHDYVIANGTGAAVRSDLNGVLGAIVSNNSGATEPATMYAYQWWADTTTGLLKIRNAANNAWVTVGTLASANLGLLSLAGGTLTGALLADDSGNAVLPAIAFDGDPDTGIFRAGANQFGIATNGVERVEFGTSEVVFNDGGADVDFRIEGDANANLLFVDASTDRLGIGTSSPGTLLDVAGVVTGQSFIPTSSTVPTNGIHLPAANTVGVSTNLEVAGVVTGQSFIPTSSTVPTNGVYLPAANTVGVSTNGGERLRVTSTGQVRLAGAGITFNGDTATANELDDYEEGTFTARCFDASSGGNQSSTTATGHYTKIGNLVTVSFFLENISTAGMTSGNNLFYALPFTANAAMVRRGAATTENVNFTTGRTAVCANVSLGNARGGLIQYGDNVSDTLLNVSDLSSGVSDLAITMQYAV